MPQPLGDEGMIQLVRRRAAPANPWLVTAVIIAGTMMVILDTTIVNVALHEIDLDLGAGGAITWITTAYFLAVCAAQPASGWLADRFGRREVFLGALPLFTLASAGCAASGNLGMLIGFRVLQGLTGGVLLPVGLAVIVGLFSPQEYTKAMSVWGMVVMLTPAIGPTVGGLLITSVSWHWLFLVNVPVGVVTVAVAFWLIPDVGTRLDSKLDSVGLVLGSGGLAVAVLGLSEGNSWGWGSPATLASLGCGGVALAAFVRHELRVDVPMIQLRMLSSRYFRLAMGAMLFVTMAQFGRLVFIPLQLESLRGFSALRVGLLLAPAAFAGMAGTWSGGRLLDAFGPRRPMMLGCVCSGAGLVGMSRLGLGTSLVWITVLLAVQSLGMGLIGPATMVAGLRDLPPSLIAQASAIRSLTGQVSGALAVAILGTVATVTAGDDPTPTESQHGYNVAFLVATVGVGVSLWLASRVPGKEAATARERLDVPLAVE